MARVVHAAVVALAVVVALGAGPGAPPASALASHVGWPPYEMLLMNKTDSDRPLDARPGHDPFGGADRTYSCDELRNRPSQSCLPLFVRRGDGYVMSDVPSSHRLLGGHGNDTIHAGGTG